jgi:8-oxo-dGTP diphosphatase
MARLPVLAAGGIVLRRQQPPLVAVVRLRKRDEWVLPKGKLDDGETPRAAAKREVLEETGHNVTVHEFLGTLVYDSGGRSKIVHYWRMEAAGEQAYELMNDIRAVDWLPLNAAVERLSRSHERVFLANVGPQALSAFARRQKAKGLASAAPASRRRRRAGAVAPEPARAARLPEPKPAVELKPAVEPMPQPRLADSVVEPTPGEAMSVPPQVIAPQPPSASGDAENSGTVVANRSLRGLARKVRDWLGRAA